MANPTTGYFTLRGDPLIDGLTTGYYWQLDPSRTVDYSISDGFNDEFWVVDPRVALGEALATISVYANINFNYVGYWATPSVSAFQQRLHSTLFVTRHFKECFF